MKGNAVLVVVLAAAGLWMGSMQQRVTQLEERLAAAERPVPGSVQAAPEPSAAPYAPDRSSIERRLAELEARPEREPPPAPIAPAPPADPAVLDRESIEDLAANFALYDTDGDGLLDPEELLVDAAELETFDLNRDRRLGADEVERLGELSANARVAAGHLDSSDGAFPIDRADFSGGGRRFAVLDRDGDEVVTESEYVANLTEAIQQLRRFDLDANGALTAAEWWDAPTRFAAADLDQDGLLYAWEVSNLMVRARW